MSIMHTRWGRLYRGTPAEHSLEPAVAALGIAYRTQLPGFLYGFRAFPDFFIPQLKLVIEVDDKSHRRADKIIADQERTEVLESFGWRVVRCTNEEATNDPSGTVDRLLSDAGISRQDIERARRIPFAGCLPQPRKAPQKVRREAISQERRRRRAGGQSAHAAPPRRPTPDPAPPATSSSPTS